MDSLVDNLKNIDKTHVSVNRMMLGMKQHTFDIADKGCMSKLGPQKDYYEVPAYFFSTKLELKNTYPFYIK